MLSAAQISFFQDPQQRAPAELLRAWPTLVNVAEAAAAAGVRVTVLQASAHVQTISRNGVDYHFLPRPASRVGQLKLDVMHVQGFGFAREVLALAALAPGLPIVLQDHADRPPRRPWRWPLWRRAFGATRGVMFCAADQAQPFRRRGLLPGGTRVYEVAESSCRFRPLDREAARRSTGLVGDPALLWVGHLNANKDPLTVLEGISRAARQLPGLRLCCCFASAPLMAAVRARIEGDPWLAGRVQLLGAVPHETIERLMNAADFLVQGSHRESSGYALIEALACGLPPLVTGIPSFRALTGGTTGRLWRCGDAQGLADALIDLAARPQAPLRAAARARFDQALSLPALGGRLRAVYQDLLT